MDVRKIRNELRMGRSIYDLPLRVTFYARVSTDMDAQLNSLENQVQYYTELIQSKPNWTFVPGYIDEGISGTSTKKRDDFNRMIRDAKAGLFDLIITKEDVTLRKPNPEVYNKIIEICKNNNSTYIQTASTKEEEERIWISRRSSFGATAKLAPNVLTEDVVVPRENIVALVKGIQEICNKYELKTCIMGHIGDGNIHPNIALDLRSPQERLNFDMAKKELFELALSLNGRLSGEHGIGCEKSEFINKAIDSNNLKMMKQIKKLFDPKNILNPDKIF